MSEPAALRTEVMDASRWEDLVAVLAPTCGGDEGCWCYDHHLPLAAGPVRGRPARLAKYSLLLEGRAHGVLAYRGEVPVGWCALDPSKDLPGHDCFEAASPEGWMIHCFVVVEAHRGQGVAHRLLAAAVELARQRGAPLLEAFPPDPHAEEAAQLGFAGTLPLYEAAGFARAGKGPGPYLRVRRSL